MKRRLPALLLVLLGLLFLPGEARPQSDAPGNGTNRVVLRHLKPGAAYTLCLYGAGDQNTHQTTFRVAGATQTTRGVPHVLHTMTAGRASPVRISAWPAIAGAPT